MKKILTIAFLFAAIGIGFAQPANDDCAGAISIPFPFPYSSGVGAFTNINATPSIYNAPGGGIPVVVNPPTFPTVTPPSWLPAANAVQRDVWFEFTTGSNSLDITLTIEADASCTTFQPKFALYKGTCNFLILQQAIGQPVASNISGSNIISMDIIDLDPNTQYFLRVDNGILGTTTAGCDFSVDISEYCAPINMPSAGGGSSNFCNDACVFYDSGGPAGPYGGNENGIWTICPPNPQGCLVLNFSTYDIDCIFDGLNIYDGNSVNSPLLTVVRGTGTNLVIEVPSGCATLQFQSNTAIDGDGWAMTWSCTNTPCTPNVVSDCNSATPVASLPFTGNYSTCGAGNNYDASDACGSGYMNGEDYTFAYTSPGNECISVTLNNTSIGTGVFVTDGCPNADATSCVASAEAVGGNPMIGSVYLQDPGTYYIVVSGETCPICTDFDIVIDQAACPMIVNPNVLASDLAEKIAGNNVDITNIQLNCPPGAYGTFEGGPGAVNIDGGIILSTGFADDAEGPNTLDGSLAFPGQDANTPIGSPGDAQLSQSITPNVSTVDACILEFDVYAPTDLLTFNYVFMSEEYLEFVGSPYNDIFGFWIRGPGILDGSTDSLISAIPNTLTPITVSSVNNNTNSSYYINNPAGEVGTAYDGYTTLLTAASPVTPCNTYHLRMAIADGIDQFFDSGVLIEEGSLFNQGVELEIAGATVGNALSCAENCLDGTITISLVAPQTDTTYVPIDIQGTALNGIDYQTIPDTLVFPPGVTSITIPIIPFADGILESTETVVLYLYEQCSATEPSDSAIIYIRDDIDGLFATNDTTICGSPVALPMTGPSDMIYNWDPSTGLSNPNAQNPMAYPDQNTTYTVIAGNGICWDTLSMDVIVATLDSPNDTIICTAGEPVLLYAVTNQPNATWTWTPATSLNRTDTIAAIATPTVTTTYNVQVVTPVCTISEDITITVFAGAANVNTDQTICEDTETVQLGVGTGDPNLNYSWSPTNGLSDPNIANPTASPDSTTTYTLTASGSNCSTSNDVTVNVLGQFTVNPIADQTVFQGESVAIQASNTPLSTNTSPVGTLTWTWTPTTGLGISGTQVDAGPLETTTYTVTAVNAAGCEASTGFTITVIPPVYGFPNAFAPNGSGDNTKFIPVVEGNIVLQKFQIFNRWGQVVYENTDLAAGWDGTINGEDAPQDTYVYAATLLLPSGEVVEEKGELLLVR